MKALYWVETKGRSLEEIDEIFEGRKEARTQHDHEQSGDPLGVESDKKISAEVVNVLVAK